MRAVWGASQAHAPAAAVLGADLARALSAPPVDFGDLVRAWVESWRREAPAFDPDTGRAMAHLAGAGRPPSPADGIASLAALPLAIPIALATHRSPRTLLATLYHAARLTTADESTAWGAVAVGVAAARFLLGKVDFIPDVLEALSVNSAPATLLARIRRVPVLRPAADGGLPEAGEDAGTRAIVAGLWLAHREPDASRAAGWSAGPGEIGGHGLVAVAGLLGARDGADRIPAAWEPTGPGRKESTEFATRLLVPESPQEPGRMESSLAAPESHL